jgi:uncharacterized protein YhfF
VTTTRERPITFSDTEVRAILDGRKTQTRMVAKFPFFDAQAMRLDSAGRVEALVSREECIRVGITDPLSAGSHWRHVVEGAGQIATCPYGQPGDRLWVRETWAKAGEIGDETEYRADNDDPTAGKWRPSIHMPRWASRITLEITAVRVERLQEISEADAMAEGVSDSANYSARDHFHRLWLEINGPESWIKNPWVWIIEFKRV